MLGVCESFSHYGESVSTHLNVGILLFAQSVRISQLVYGFVSEEIFLYIHLMYSCEEGGLGAPYINTLVNSSPLQSLIEGKEMHLVVKWLFLPPRISPEGINYLQLVNYL